MSSFLEYSQAEGFKNSTYKYPVECFEYLETIHQSGWVRLGCNGGGMEDGSAIDLALTGEYAPLKSFLGRERT